MKHVVIIGNGISGITAARHIRKQKDYRITVISSESKYFYSRTALMYVYMGHMQYEHTKPYEDWFWKKNNIDLIQAYVSTVDTDRKLLVFADNGIIKYDILIIASGSVSHKIGWKGQDLKGVQALYNIQDLQQMEENTQQIKNAVVVGGGLIGIEMAEMLRSRNINVTFLVREKNYFNATLPLEESLLINKHILSHGVNLLLETELEEIKGDENNRVKEIVTTKGVTIPCEFVGLTIGVTPNISFLQKSKIEFAKGILVNNFFETNIPGVYAIGDCAEFREQEAGNKKIEQLWYTGKRHGEIVAETICNEQSSEYKKAVFFNSAKFFDIEYQVYGNVPTLPDQKHQALFWQHADGRKSIRLVYDSEHKNIVGFNLLGVRYRQEVCSDWIRNRKPIEFVLQNLSVANFDPEFSNKFELELVNAYNQQHPGSNISLKSKRGLFDLFKLRETQKNNG